MCIRINARSRVQLCPWDLCIDDLLAAAIDSGQSTVQVVQAVLARHGTLYRNIYGNIAMYVAVNMAMYCFRV